VRKETPSLNASSPPPFLVSHPIVRASDKVVRPTG
jgi:hypothetical protein